MNSHCAGSPPPFGGRFYLIGYCYYAARRSCCCWSGRAPACAAARGGSGSTHGHSSHLNLAK